MNITPYSLKLSYEFVRQPRRFDAGVVGVIRTSIAGPMALLLLLVLEETRELNRIGGTFNILAWRSQLVTSVGLFDSSSSGRTDRRTKKRNFIFNKNENGTDSANGTKLAILLIAPHLNF